MLLCALSACGDASRERAPADANDESRDAQPSMHDAAMRDADPIDASSQKMDAGREDAASADASEDASMRDAASDDAARADAQGTDAAPTQDSGVDVSIDAGPEPPRFVDVTEAVGLVYAQAPAHTGTNQQWYNSRNLLGDSPYMTGGAAAADWDGDGDVDLYVTRLEAPGILFDNRRVQGELRFVDVTAAVGLDAIDAPTVGPAWGDVDNDGDPDLYVTTIDGGRFLLFINTGVGFVEDGVARGAALQDAAPHRGFSASFGDFDRDGWLDVHTCEWQSDVLPPPVSAPHARLLRNRGGDGMPGHFEDVTATAGVDLFNADPAGSQAFASSFSDLDDDGWPELIVASDWGTSRLFDNGGDGTFTDITSAAGVGTDENGMGLAIGDYDGDGLLDFFVTSIHCTGSAFLCPLTGNRLFRNRGDGGFDDRTDEANVRDGSWGWGTSFLDFDNDADLDLVMTNGIRFAHPDFTQFYSDPMRLWENQGGTMLEVSQAFDLIDHGDGKGLLVLDYDADGDEDIFVANHVTGGKLYENRIADSSGHAWLRLVLRGQSANRMAFGARVRVERTQGAATLVRELRGGNNFLGQNEAVIHLGLGPGLAPVHRIEITWPSPGTRTQQVLTDVTPNQVLVIDEP
jgi:hypothetical protein